jgi:dihydrofolate reductase
VTAIRGFIAASLDGYIADKHGGVAFLKPYESIDYGFTEFFGEIGTCVFGRATYEQSFTFGAEWPFAGKRVIVVASKPLARRPSNVEVWDRGVARAFVEHLRAAKNGDVWIVGGGMLQSALFDLDGVDRLQLGLVPVLLGDGIPLFGRSTRQHRLALTGVAQLAKGLVMLDYRRA